MRGKRAKRLRAEIKARRIAQTAHIEGADVLGREILKYAHPGRKHGGPTGHWPKFPYPGSIKLEQAGKVTKRRTRPEAQAAAEAKRERRRARNLALS